MRRISFGFFGAITTGLAILMHTLRAVGIAALVVWWAVVVVRVIVVVVALVTLAGVVAAAVAVWWPVLVHALLRAGTVMLCAGVIITASDGCFS